MEITLLPNHEQFIKEKLNSGRYESINEIISNKQ